MQKFAKKYIILPFGQRVRKKANVPVAQLDRVSDSDSDGCRFESCRVHQKYGVSKNAYAVFLVCVPNYRIRTGRQSHCKRYFVFIKKQCDKTTDETVVFYPVAR